VIVRKLFLWGVLAVALTAAAPKAHAGFVFFNVPGLHAGESVRVAEQIVCANGPCTVLDYQFFLLNTGVIGIDGFAMGLGVVGNGAAQIAAGMVTVATAGGGGDGPFPDMPAGGVNNGGTAILGPCGLIPAACNPAFLGPAAWGFEEFQDAGTGGGLPNTFYITRWYKPTQGFNGTCALNRAAANAAGILCPGQTTRLDLITVFPPAGGNGAVDPPADDPFFGFDDIGGDTGDVGGNTNPEFDLDSDLSGSNNAGDTWTQPCDPETQSCGTPDSYPNSDPQFASATNALEETPEPAGFILIGAGLFAVIAFRRKRKAA
jgi:hypothetical protein